MTGMQMLMNHCLLKETCIECNIFLENFAYDQVSLINVSPIKFAEI